MSALLAATLVMVPVSIMVGFFFGFWWGVVLLSLGGSVLTVFLAMWDAGMFCIPRKAKAS